MIKKCGIVRLELCFNQIKIEFYSFFSIKFSGESVLKCFNYGGTWLLRRKKLWTDKRRRFSLINNNNNNNNLFNNNIATASLTCKGEKQ